MKKMFKLTFEYLKKKKKRLALTKSEKKTTLFQSEELALTVVKFCFYDMQIK